MTCRRLEKRDLLARMVEKPDRHTRRCPDCSARVRGYQRIAGWIAEGKTSHRAPADWRHRTLAQLRAAASAGGATPSASPQPRARASSSLIDATVPTPGWALPSRRPPRKARLVAAFALASAAIVVATLIAAMTRGEEPVTIAIGTEPTGSTPPGNARPPHVPSQSAPSISPSGPPSGERSGSPSGERSGSPSGERSGSPSGERSGSSSGAPSGEPPVGPSNPIRRAQGPNTAGPGPSPGQRRGVNVTIDIPPSDPATPAQPTIDVSIDTTPPGARVLLGGTVLGTTPYRGTLPRSERQLKLAISLADFVDEVITVDASRPITRHLKLVPIQRDR
jgi:hypothetical protein